MGIIQKQGIRNTVITYIGIFMGFINLMVLQPIFLTAEEIGLTRVLFEFSTLVAVFLPLGVGHITVRYFPTFKDREKKHRGFFGFMLLFPVTGFLFTSLFLFLFRDFFIAYYAKESKLFTEYFNYVIPLSFFIGLVTVFNIYCFALFRTTFPSFLNDIITRIFVICVISIYFLKWININQFILLFVLAYGFQMLILLIYIFWIDRPGFKINFPYLKQQNLPGIFNYGFLLAFASVASVGLKSLGTIMTGHYLQLSLVGIYAIAAFIPTFIEAPLNSLEKISNTKIAAALALNNKNEIRDIYYKSSRYLLLLGGLLFLGVNINIESLLNFLPAEYHSGVNVVLIISIGTLFNMAAGSNTSIIFNSERYRFGAFLLIFLVVIAFACNMIFIPMFGIEGAAVAAAVSSLLYSLIKYLFIWNHNKMQPFDLNTVKIIFLIGFCFALNYFIPVIENNFLNIILRSVIITLVYSSGAYFLRIVPEFDKHIPFAVKK